MVGVLFDGALFLIRDTVVLFLFLMFLSSFSRALCSAAQEVSSDKLEVLLGPGPTSGKSYLL